MRRGELRETITGAFERTFGEAEGDRLRTGLGMDFFFDEPEKGLLRIDTTTFQRSVSDRFDLLADFLVADQGTQRSDKGLFPALEETLDEIARSLAVDLDPVGGRSLIINLLA